MLTNALAVDKRCLQNSFSEVRVKRTQPWRLNKVLEVKLSIFFELFRHKFSIEIIRRVRGCRTSNRLSSLVQQGIVTEMLQPKKGMTKPVCRQ